MNAKRTVLLGIITATSLTASVAMAAPHVQASHATASRSANTRPAFTPRTNTGLTSAPRIATSSRPAVSSASAHQWSGNGNNWQNHHHHHHHSRIVFVGGFGYPYYPWSYYPYDYGYNSYDRPVVYEDARSSDEGSLVVEVQRRLARAGYYHGSIDGILGPGTRRAIRAYERAHNLRVDGTLSDRLLDRMDLR